MTRRTKELKESEEWALALEWALAARDLAVADQRIIELSHRLGVPKSAYLNRTLGRFEWEEQR